MEHDLNNTIALLERTPAALDALLRGLPNGPKTTKAATHGTCPACWAI